METLDEGRVREAAFALAARDPDLAGVVSRYGTPPLWARLPGFPTLIKIILARNERAIALNKRMMEENNQIIAENQKLIEALQQEAARAAN